MFNINFNTIRKEKSVAVAVSGGIDSMALTLLVNDFAKKNKIKLITLTVDHKLRKVSTGEAKFVQKLMKKHGIEHHILTWESRDVNSNIEFHARKARYDLLTNFCKKNQIKYLLVGHHKQDQAENFLIRLFRGSGIDGLASMKDETEINGVKILRLLLDIKKEDLREYLLKNKVDWIEDKTNEDENFLRNKIRKFLNGFDDKDNIINRINSSVNVIAKVREIIEKDLSEKSKKIVQIFPEGYIRIKKDKFRKLDEELGLRLLAWVLMEVSGNMYKPRFEKLKDLYKYIISSKKIKPRTFSGCVIESDKSNIKNSFFIYRERSAISNDVNRISDNKLLWDNRFEIETRDNKKFSLDDVMVKNLTESELKKIVKKLNLEKKVIGIYKKVILTTPAISLNNFDFIYIPHLNYSNDLSFSKNISMKRRGYSILSF